MWTSFLLTLFGGIIGSACGAAAALTLWMRYATNEKLEHRWRLEEAGYGSSIHDE